MRQLLAVSWAMPPLLLPRSIQVSRTLKSLAELGWQTTVVCVDPASVSRASLADATLDARYSPYFRLVRIGSVEETLSRRLLWRLVPALTHLPDRQRVWVARAVRAAEGLLAQQRFSALISFAQPWSDHLVGLALHRASGIPWIAHFSDPWVDSPYLRLDGWVGERCRRMEETVIREASAVVFVSSETADLVMRKYPASWRDEVHVIPHCYEARALPPTIAPQASAASLRLVYTGNFYGPRGPVPFLEALALLHGRASLQSRLRMTFVGLAAPAHVAAAVRLGLTGIVEFLGPRPFLDTEHIAAQADVLVVIDAADPSRSVFLPSKLVEYLSFRKPILGITPPAGASADLLRRLECPVVAPDDVAAIAGIIEELLAQRLAGPLRPSAVFDSVAREFEASNTARAFDRVLVRCVPAHPVSDVLPGRRHGVR